MKALKLLIVLLLLGWQANATGFSHNMLVAQKMLNAKEKSICCVEKKAKSSSLQVAAKPTVVKQSTHPATESSEEEATIKPSITAVSLSQHIARWVVRIVSVGGEVLTEMLMSVFSLGNESTLPANASLISLTDNVLSYLIVPLKVFL